MSFALRKKRRKSTIRSEVNLTPLIDVMTSYHPEYSVGSTRRGKTHDVIFENIRLRRY